MKQDKRIRRHKRVRAKISGDDKRPRLVVFRSNMHNYASLINDKKGITLISSSDIKEKIKGNKESAYKIGQEIAKLAIEKKIKKVVFDRAGYKYHGRVESIARGAREAGLKF